MNSRRWIAIIACMLFFAGLATKAHGATTLSTEEFIQNKAKWDGYAKLSSRLKVEGKYTSISPQLMRLSKCDLLFRPKASQKLPTLNGTSVNVEVEGSLEKTGGKFQFVVEVLRPMPSDDQVFFEKKRKLEVSKSDGWYELGDWALARGTFYEDAGLKKMSEESYRRGIQIEYENLPKDDVPARFKLADKGAKYNLGGALHAELVHEAYRIESNAIQSAKNGDFKKLLERMELHMPGTTEPLTTMPAELETRYRLSPLSVYRESDGETRKKLHRLLHNDVVLNWIERNANRDGSNGTAVAEQIDHEIPEWHTRGDGYRERELEFKLTQVPSYTQQQAVALAEQFDTRGKPDKAKQVRVQWLAERTKQVGKDDPEGMLFLSEQYEALLSDKETAVRLLQEAWEKHPDSTEIAAALGQHGYTLKDGKWLPSSDVKDQPLDAQEQAIRDGRIEKGMSRQQVERALGKPSSVTRIATNGAVSEVWVYREKNVNRVTVHFQRISGRNADARVVASF